MLQYFPNITGSLTVSGDVIVSGSIATTQGITISGSIDSASYSSNSELLDNLDSTAFVFTSSFNTYSSSMSTRTTTLENASASLNTASGSFSGRVTTIESKYATTGSNIFTGAQTVCANITSTGTIIAQTLNVQQVTSSVVYSSGSNVFGCSLSNTQQFTGSVTMTGSLGVVGVSCFSNAVCALTFNSVNLAVSGGVSNVLLSSNNNEVLRIQGFCQPGMFITFNSGSTVIGDIGNSSQTFSSGDANGFGINARGSRVLQLGTNQSARMTIAATGETTFSSIVCAPNATIANCLGIGVASPQGNFEAVGLSYFTRTNNSLLVNPNYGGANTHAQLQVVCNMALAFATNGDNERMRITATGEACFRCQICAPQYITTQGSSVSYAAGTNYIVWSSEGEICSQDNNTGGTYTTMKTWIADRTGCLTLRFAGYIASGPNYWAWRVVRNGTTSLVCAYYLSCLAPGCSTSVHAYTTFQSDIGPVNPGDCITLQMVSSNSGGTPVNGAGQYLFAKELRLHSTTPNFSAGIASNVFGDRLGVGTCTPGFILHVAQTCCAGLTNVSIDNTAGCTASAGTQGTILRFRAASSDNVVRTMGAIASYAMKSIGSGVNNHGDLRFYTGVEGDVCERMRIASTGVACFACTVCAPILTTQVDGFNPSANTTTLLTTLPTDNAMYIISVQPEAGSGGPLFAFITSRTNSNPAVTYIVCNGSCFSFQNSGFNICVKWCQSYAIAAKWGILRMA